MANRMFPDPAPSIPLQIDARACLLHDFDRYDNGALVMTLTSCTLSTKGATMGELITSAGGTWFARIGRSLYELPMTDIFAAVYAAHQERIADLECSPENETAPATAQD